MSDKKEANWEELADEHKKTLEGVIKDIQWSVEYFREKPRKNKKAIKALEEVIDECRRKAENTTPESLKWSRTRGSMTTCVVSSFRVDSPERGQRAEVAL